MRKFLFVLALLLLALIPGVALADTTLPVVSSDVQVQQWQIVVAFFVPIVVAAIAHTFWPPAAKAVLTFLVSSAVAAGTLYIRGELDLGNLVPTSLTVLVAAVAFYHGIYKPTGAADAIETNINVIPTLPAPATTGK